MFLIIYLDGNYIIKSDLETAVSLPGNYFIFSVGTTFQFNQVDGVCYYNKNTELDKLRINHFELIDIEKLNYSKTPPFRFSIYDHTSDTIKKIIPNSYSFEGALSSIIIMMISASKFPTWDTYDKIIKIDQFEYEIKNLKEQIEILKKLNDELKERLSSFENSSS